MSLDAIVYWRAD